MFENTTLQSRVRSVLYKKIITQESVQASILYSMRVIRFGNIGKISPKDATGNGSGFLIMVPKERNKVRKH